MKFIVYRNPFYFYDVKQGKGYFVSYKDKLSELLSVISNTTQLPRVDDWSPNWFDAKKYSSIGSAITRLGIQGLDCISIDDFIKQNIFSKSDRRDLIISSILDEETPERLLIERVIEHKGRIETIGDDGKLLGDAKSLIIDFIEKKINKTKNKFDNKMKKIGMVPAKPVVYDRDFFNEWIKN